MTLSLRESLDPFVKSPDVASDLKKIARFFDIGVTSATMAELTRMTPSSLSRARRLGTKSVRQAKHIAVLAAFTFELGKWFGEAGVAIDESGRYRWLLSGRLETAGGPRRPIEVFKETKDVVVALDEIRLERGRLRKALAAAALPGNDTA